VDWWRRCPCAVFHPVRVRRIRQISRGSFPGFRGKRGASPPRTRGRVVRPPLTKPLVEWYGGADLHRLRATCPTWASGPFHDYGGVPRRCVVLSCMPHVHNTKQKRHRVRKAGTRSKTVSLTFRFRIVPEKNIVCFLFTVLYRPPLVSTSQVATLCYSH
jgi:hypothetical protein